MLAPLLAVLGVLRAVLSLLAALAHAATVELVISSSVQYSTVQYSTAAYLQVSGHRALTQARTLWLPEMQWLAHRGHELAYWGLSWTRGTWIYRRNKIRRSRLLGSAVSCTITEKAPTRKTFKTLWQF